MRRLSRQVLELAPDDADAKTFLDIAERRTPRTRCRKTDCTDDPITEANTSNPPGSGIMSRRCL